MTSLTNTNANGSLYFQKISHHLKTNTMKPSEKPKSVQQFIEFCKHQHDVVCNQKYAEIFPYSFHLEIVRDQARKFMHLIAEENYRTIDMACAAHDLIEDARLSYNDIKELASLGDLREGQDIAEIVFLCTEMRGRTRAERKPEQFYLELRENKLAVFVKLCDIIANSLFSATTHSSMLKRYKQEYPKIKDLIFIPEYADMFKYLESIYEL